MISISIEGLSDINELPERLRGDIISSIKGTLREECMLVLKEHVESDVYGNRDGNGLYQATNSLIGAVDVKNMTVGATSASFELYINADKLTRRRKEGQVWGAYMGFSGQDMAHRVIGFLENGGGAIPNVFEGLTPRHFLQNTADELDTKAAQILAKALVALGWDAG